MKATKFFKITLLCAVVFGVMTMFSCSEKHEPAPKLYVGKKYQGGIIAYLNKTGKHGLITAPEDQSVGIQWCNGKYIRIKADSTAIGTGKINTDKIVEVQKEGDYAAKLCKDLVIEGYKDWFLPSKDELNELYKNKDLIGEFSKDYYWSSTESGNEFNAWIQSFDNGFQSLDGIKQSPYRVRAVRAF